MDYRWFKELTRIVLSSNEFKKLVIQLLGSSFAKAVGFKAWLIGFIVDLGVKKIVIPLINYLTLEGLLLYDKSKGKLLVKKLKGSIDEGDRDTWLDITTKL